MSALAHLTILPSDLCPSQSSVLNTCYISGTELGSGNTEIKALVSEAHRLVERRLKEQLQGIIIVGGN